MATTTLDTPRTLLAYFSHSYRPGEKEINLFFWELLSRHHLYFTVDSEENRNKPMDTSYLEWMMQRSACFVAVIPRRDDSPRSSCSPYQVFENGLAIRAKKPRLIFVEAGLDTTIFGVQPDEVCVFRRRQEWLEEDKDRFAQAASRLAFEARVFASPDSGFKPVLFLADTRQGGAYDLVTVKAIRQVVRDQGFSSFKPMNPADIEHDFLFLQDIERCSVLISEVRPPYMAPDLFGLVHDRCVPTVRICHLEEQESAEMARAAMHLPYDESKWDYHGRGNWPLILSKYQIDNDMEPVIFWNHLEELTEKVSARLQKITQKRRDLISDQEARNYFLSIGRLPGRVFISNAKAKNDFVDRLKPHLTRNAVEEFHYKDKDAIAIGSGDWPADIIREINNSVIFVALIDSNYEQSKWCMMELREAVQLFNRGEIEVHAYVVEAGVKLPQELSMMQVDFIEALDEIEKIGRIVGNSVNFLEKGKRVDLRLRDRDRIVNVLAKLPCFASPSDRRKMLRDTGLPAHVIEKVRTEGKSSEVAAGEIVDDLVASEQELKPHTKALGLLLSHVMPFTDPADGQLLLANMIRSYWLMPDIRKQIDPIPYRHEFDVAYLHEQGELGTFQSIEKGAIVKPNLEQGELGANLYALSVGMGADQNDWQKILRIIGSEIFRNKASAGLLKEYKRTLDLQVTHKEQIGFCFATDSKGLRVPFEWAIVEGQSSPLCLNHPIRRFWIGGPEPRLTVRTILEGRAAIPLRVLLIASNTGGISQVEDEIEEIYAMLCDLFAKVGWPESNICKLNSQAATPDRIEKEIVTGHYHILHYAGHGGFEEGKPGLQIWLDAEMQDTILISATMLKNWVVESDLGFVYLSTCRGASTEVPEFSSQIRHFENIMQAMTEALVPETIGFVWPIEDTASRVLARQFYRRFLKEFDPALALYHARTSFEEENRIWAAPVLIQQTDTPI